MPLFFFFLVLFCVPALASPQPQSLGKTGDWEAFQMQEDGQPVCFMTQTIQPATPKPVKGKKPTAARGPATIMITHRPAENSLDVLSYHAGIKLRPASEATLAIDGKQSFALFTQNDTAWSRDATTDRAIAAAIRAGNNLVFTGTTTRNLRINDTISLRGSSAAYKAISTACGLK